MFPYRPARARVSTPARLFHALPEPMRAVFDSLSVADDYARRPACQTGDDYLALCAYVIANKLTSEPGAHLAKMANEAGFTNITAADFDTYRRQARSVPNGHTEKAITHLVKVVTKKLTRKPSVRAASTLAL